MTPNFPFFNFNTGAYISGQQIPRVKGIEEARNYPCPPNTEVILMDTDDETVLYFRKTDANGYATVERHRHYPDPEPTQQEINDQRYVTVTAFNQFKEDVLSAIRSTAKQSNAGSASQNKKYDENRSNQRKPGTDASVNGSI